MHIRKGTYKFYPYGSTEPLSTLGKSLVKFNDEETEAELIVISGKGKPLLGRKLNYTTTGNVEA